MEIDERIHQAAPHDNRSEWRSTTPMGFSNAVYEWNEEKSVFDC